MTAVDVERAGLKSSNVKIYRFWQHNNKQIEWWGLERRYRNAHAALVRQRGEKSRKNSRY